MFLLLRLFALLGFAGLLTAFCGLANPEDSWPMLRTVGIVVFSACAVAVFLIARKYAAGPEDSFKT